jgi:hypothetical protein
MDCILHLSTFSMDVAKPEKDCDQTAIIVMAKYIHTFHSLFIPQGVAEAPQIFLQDVLQKLLS